MSTTDLQEVLATLKEAGPQILGTKYAFIALYTITLYDFIISIPREIEYIWNRNFSMVTVLYFMNRYYGIAAFTVALAAYFSPLFTHDVCSRFALFIPFALGVPMTIFPGIVMGLRVSALYHRNKIVEVGLTTFLCAEFAVAMWEYSFPGSHPLEIPPVVHGDAFQICIDATADSLGNIKSATFQFMETIYDTAIFVMVLYKTIHALRFTKRRELNITVLMATHSIVYFAVIFTSNLVWALMIILAPSGLKYATAVPTIMLVCVLVNRMTLDLRAFSTTGVWFSATKNGAPTMNGIPPSEFNIGGQDSELQTGFSLFSETQTQMSTYVTERPLLPQNTLLKSTGAKTGTVNGRRPTGRPESTGAHPSAFEVIEMGRMDVVSNRARFRDMEEEGIDSGGNITGSSTVGLVDTDDSYVLEPMASASASSHLRDNLPAYTSSSGHRGYEN